MTEALERSTDCRTTAWFNSTNVNWWFDKFVKKINEYGFARRATAEETIRGEGEAVWLPNMHSRVVLSDETCVSSAGHRKTTNPKKKVITTAERVEKEDHGPKYRRIIRASGTMEH